MLENEQDGLTAPPPLAAIGVLVLCFFFNLVARGAADTFMVFLLPLQARFGWERAQITSVYSAMMLTSGLASPLAGVIFERYGPRALYAGGVACLAVGYMIASQATQLWHFYLAIGLFVGLGGGAVGMVPASAILSWWHGARLGSAIGIAYAGFGCGSLLMVPLAQEVIDLAGWQSAYSRIGIALFALVLVTWWLPWRAISVRRPSDASGGETSRKLGPLRAASRDRRFWLLVQIMFFTALGMYLVIVQSVAYLVEAGFSPFQAAAAFGACGMLSIVGLSSSGWASDRFGARTSVTASFVGTTLGIGSLYALAMYPSPYLLVAYVLLFGICQGARGPVVAGLSARLFRGRGQATVYGAIHALTAIGTAAGALLSGALHDWTGSYHAGFCLALIGVALAALPFWISDDLVVAARRS